MEWNITGNLLPQYNPFTVQLVIYHMINTSTYLVQYRVEKKWDFNCSITPVTEQLVISKKQYVGSFSSVRRGVELGVLL